jgi:hypothetical protein
MTYFLVFWLTKGVGVAGGYYRLLAGVITDQREMGEIGGRRERKES